MRRTARRWLLILVAPLAGCGAAQPPSPYYGDERYLVFGVRPDAEALALAQQIEATGYTAVRQVNGQNFTALGFDDEQGLPAKVRVVTARGIALALDPEPPDPLQKGVRYSLLPAPLADTQDADGDGFEEVFVEAQPEDEPPCILIYRVRDSGFVDATPAKSFALAREPELREGAWLEPQFCEDEGPDSNASGTPEAEPDAAPAKGDAQAGSPGATSGSEPAPATAPNPSPPANGAATTPKASDPPPSSAPGAPH